MKKPAWLTPSQAWFHIVAAHSERVAIRFLKLDYLGIILNIATTAATFVYAGLYGKLGLQAFYITLVLACAIAMFSAVLSPFADGPGAAKWR